MAVTQIGSVETAILNDDRQILGYTLAAGDDRIVVVTAGAGGGTGVINSVTIDGTLATIQETGSSGDRHGAIAWRVMGSSGSPGSIDITSDIESSSAGNSSIRVMTFEGVDQASPIADSGIDNGSGGSSSVVLSSAVDGLCVDGIISSEDWSEDGGQSTLGSQIYTGTSRDYYGWASEEAGAASVTMGWSGGNGDFIHTAMALAEAAAADAPKRDLFFMGAVA